MQYFSIRNSSVVLERSVSIADDRQAGILVSGVTF